MLDSLSFLFFLMNAVVTKKKKEGKGSFIERLLSSFAKERLHFKILTGDHESMDVPCCDG